MLHISMYSGVHMCILAHTFSTHMPWDPRVWVCHVASCQVRLAVVGGHMLCSSSLHLWAGLAIPVDQKSTVEEQRVTSRSWLQEASCCPPLPTGPQLPCYQAPATSLRKRQTRPSCLQEATQDHSGREPSRQVEPSHQASCKLPTWGTIMR